jgi:monoamine oxidase
VTKLTPGKLINLGALRKKPSRRARLGGSVRRESPVIRIEVSGDKVTATTAGGQFDGRQIIVTAPPLLAGRISYEPRYRTGASSSPSARRWAR